MGRSLMRRETVDAKPGECYSPPYADALYMIRDAVRRRERLIYGKLDGPDGQHCAIGAYFEDNPKTALKTTIIDEVAAYNDSIPRWASERERRRKVLAWLNFKLRQLVGTAGRGRVPKDQGAPAKQ